MVDTNMEKFTQDKKIWQDFFLFIDSSAGIRVLLEWKKSWSFLHLVSRSCVIEISSSEQNKAHMQPALVVHVFELSFLYGKLLLYLFYFSPGPSWRNTLRTWKLVSNSFFLINSMVGIRVVFEWKKSRSFLHLVSRYCVIEIFSSEQTKTHTCSQPVFPVWKY